VQEDGCGVEGLGLGMARAVATSMKARKMVVKCMVWSGFVSSIGCGRSEVRDVVYEERGRGKLISLSTYVAITFRLPTCEGVRSSGVAGRTSDCSQSIVE
jgi:hypothetical protein